MSVDHFDARSCARIPPDAQVGAYHDGLTLKLNGWGVVAVCFPVCNFLLPSLTGGQAF